MSEPLLTKRLHISGLTPSITPTDLERRLSSFGKVKAMDGIGARDALGDPRKFGFVTMEIGTKELTRMNSSHHILRKDSYTSDIGLNVLSGSTWKGAKLRIGEAKPDFRERLSQINSQPPRPFRLKRTRARNHGQPSSTLPLIPLSATAAASTPGWIVTPSGRVVRPMRMRPERPLESMHSELVTSKVQGLNGKVKKRIKPPPVRARRRLIDPTKWDSVYLKGVFLDAVPIPLLASNDVLEPLSLVKPGVIDEEDGGEMDEYGTDGDGDASSTPLQSVPRLVQDRAYSIQSNQQSSEVAVSTPSRMHQTTEFIDVREETNAALAMLSEIFGDKEEWDGRESVDEMEGLDENEARDKEMQADEEDEFVSRDVGEDERRKTIEDKSKGKEKRGEEVHFSHENEAEHDRDVEMEDDPQVHVEVSVPTAESAPRTNLKALFAPKEDASFSLLDHLNLAIDLELDPDILGISAPSGVQSQGNSNFSQAILPTPHVVEISATKSTAKARSRVTLDPSLPLLFPSLDSLPHPHPTSSNPTVMTRQHGTSSCFSFPSATRVQGLHYLPSSIAFTRSPQDTSESIRDRWERDKSSLTREWKRAWHEARGSRRGRVGAGGEVGGGY